MLQSTKNGKLNPENAPGTLSVIWGGQNELQGTELRGERASFGEIRESAGQATSKGEKKRTEKERPPPSSP